MSVSWLWWFLVRGPLQGLVWSVHVMTVEEGCCLLKADVNLIRHSCSRLEVAAKKGWISHPRFWCFHYPNRQSSYNHHPSKACDTPNGPAVLLHRLPNFYCGKYCCNLHPTLQKHVVIWQHPRFRSSCTQDLGGNVNHCHANKYQHTLQVPYSRGHDAPPHPQAKNCPPLSLRRWLGAVAREDVHWSWPQIGKFPKQVLQSGASILPTGLGSTHPVFLQPMIQQLEEYEQMLFPPSWQWQHVPYALQWGLHQWKYSISCKTSDELICWIPGGPYHHVGNSQGEPLVSCHGELSRNDHM